MARGRKPKPTRLKELEGNPGRRPLNAGEPRPDALAPEDKPQPGVLDRVGLAEWRRLLKCCPPGLLTKADRALVIAYCVFYQQAVDAQKRLREEGEVVEAGRGGTKVSPWVYVRDRALRELRACAAELGLTPSSRSRVSVPEADEKADILEFLKGA